MQGPKGQELLMSGPHLQAARGRGRGRGGDGSSLSSNRPGVPPQGTHAGRAERMESPRSLPDSTERKQLPRLAGRGRARPRKPEQQLYVPRGRRDQGQEQVSKTQNQDNPQTPEKESSKPPRHVSPKTSGQTSAKRSASGSKKGRPEVQVYVPKPRRKHTESAVCDADNMNAAQSSSQEPPFGVDMEVEESGHLQEVVEIDTHDFTQLQNVLAREDMDIISHEANNTDLLGLTNLDEGVQHSDNNGCESEPSSAPNADTDLINSGSYQSVETPETSVPQSEEHTATDETLTGIVFVNNESDNPSTTGPSLQQHEFVASADTNETESPLNLKHTSVKLDMTEPLSEQSEHVKLEGNSQNSEMPVLEPEACATPKTFGPCAVGDLDGVQPQEGTDVEVTSMVTSMDDESVAGDCLSAPSQQASHSQYTHTEQFSEQCSDNASTEVSLSEEAEGQEKEVNLRSADASDASSDPMEERAVDQTSESLSNGKWEERKVGDVADDSEPISCDMTAPTETIIERNDDSRLSSDEDAVSQDAAVCDDLKDAQKAPSQLGNTHKDTNATNKSTLNTSVVADEQVVDSSTTSRSQSADKPSDGGDASSVAVSSARKENDEMEEEEEEEDSWDKIFDDDGECLDPGMIEELTEHVGEVEISRPKKTINYLDFQPKEPDMDMTAYSHVIEISNFPAEFQTRDLLVAFKDYMSRGFDVKWVDDTHALGVFSSSIAAADALKMIHPMMQLKPLTEASKQSRSKAKRTQEFLQPYKARPVTSVAAARRLVTGALGMTPRLSKEQRAEERKVLKEAREKKKQDRKQKEAVWDGTCAMDS